MKPGKVIGTVTLGVRDPAFHGGRWVVISPMSQEQLTGNNRSAVSSAWSLVAYDDLGAGVGDEVLYVEGAEAMQPFDRPIPLDAITVALLDSYQFTPPTES
ncbi:MAG: EutN/CcmL family microcompartment protein [Opitutae bacterium]|nr:EutN/CcmL family microcompartment protein [Opitutae bacterium]